MKWLAGLLFSAVAVVALVSCGGGGAAPGVPIVNDYRAGYKPIVKPESLCGKNPNGQGYICSTGNPSCGLNCEIAASAVDFEGLHPCGSYVNDPGEGCMWSVDQVLMSAGAGELGNGSYNIDSAVLSAGNQITIEPAIGYIAQAGDLVDWWGGDGQTSLSGCQQDTSCFEHIGVCLNRYCTNAIANSTMASEAAGECSFTDFGSALNPKGQSSSFTSATIIHVNY